MSNILNKQISLSLNKFWSPVCIRSIKEALVDLISSETMNDNSCLALDIDYEMIDGQPNFDNPIKIVPLAWSEWCKLPIRDWEFEINTPKMKIRAPICTVALLYEKMPEKLFRKTPNADGIKMRDRNRCQYTGVELNRNNFSIDHIIPKSRGGKDHWTNMVACDKSINFKKGNKMNSELGLKLIKEPTVPRSMKAFETITEEKHINWRPFLFHNK